MIPPSMRLPALALSILPMTADASSAQQVDGAFATMRRSPSYRSVLFQGAYRSGAWQVSKCAPEHPSATAAVGMLEAPVFDEEGQPQSGRWVEHVLVDGCSRAWRLNVLVMVPKPRMLATVPMAPGTTRADPVLQRDAARFAFAGAQIDPNGCKPIYLADTAYAAASLDSATSRDQTPWSETWTVAQCDRKIAVALTFTPQTGGIAIAARLAR